MSKKKKDKTRFSLKDRFRYWFDNRMTGGSLGLIRILIIASILLAVIIAALIILFRFNEEGETASVFWDSIATVINAWMPSFEDGSPGYVILMSVTAIAGVLFTSVLIGIITSAIEEKIDNLKRGNSMVLEKGHIIILGFSPGEYTLIRQLILASSGKSARIVVAEDMDREEIEQDLKDNLEIPKNVRIICRTVDITDPVSLEKCSIETCRTVIISPTDDMRTIKSVLAVSTLLKEKNVSGIRVNAIISKNEYRFPPSLAKDNNILTLQTNNIMAKMVAHSCTQTGLSEAFREIFNFEGSEFYLSDIPEAAGLTFGELMIRLDGAVPVGVLRKDKVTINPPSDLRILETDRILVFSDDNDSAKLKSGSLSDMAGTTVVSSGLSEDLTDTVIIGHNETLPVILQELPENISHVYLAGQKTTEEEREELQKAADERNLTLNYYRGNPRSEKVLRELSKMAQHIVILSDHDGDPEKADMDAVFLLLNLRDIRKRFGLSFNITMEMQKEHNQKLVGSGDHTDFLVASSMSSLILSQISESPELMDVFRELLSNEGNELYLKNAGSMGLTGSFTVRELRHAMYENNCVMLGCLDSEKHGRFNLPLEETVELSEDDELIVLGEC